MSFNPNLALKTFLFRRGVTQRTLAFETGINEARLSKIIRGYEKPNKEMKGKIADFLCCTEEEIFPEGGD